MRSLDLIVIVAYLAGVLGVGAWFSRRQSGASDYFLGRNELPWWAVMLSIVATETSALTVISVPGVGARGDLTFLQLPMGYVLGRVGVALWLLPGYFTGTQETAYARLESRFGGSTRRVASAVFMGVRAMGDSVRVFATAIPLTIVTGWSIPTSVLILGVFTVIYTWAGGLKAVVWVDVMQLGVYVMGGITALYVAVWLAGGADVVWAHATTGNKLRVFDFSFSFSQTYTFWGGLLGGAMLSAASHGTDHLIVQRLLASRGLRDARKALLWSGIVVLFQFALFLLIGIAISASGQTDPTIAGDRIFPQFVVDHLPAGLAGLVVAGILAAAMSTISSSLNSLASATTHDFYAPLSGQRDERRLLTVGRWATAGWAVILSLGALLFRGSGQPVVELALSIASITYGGLLGTYILAGTVPRARGRDAILAIAVTGVVMAVVVLAKPGPFAHLAFPWYVPMGVGIALLVGLVSSLVGTRERGNEGT
ncbi:MAG: sodium:solute symporter [Gemmatimonadetes bacterium]|nr:sodium:solute symporter [Gemmatimonadota bacterium]